MKKTSFVIVDLHFGVAALVSTLCFVLFSSHCVLVVIPDKTLGNTMVSWFLSQSNTFHNPNLTNKTYIEKASKGHRYDKII